MVNDAPKKANSTCRKSQDDNADSGEASKYTLPKHVCLAMVGVKQNKIKGFILKQLIVLDEIHPSIQYVAAV